MAVLHKGDLYTVCAAVQRKVCYVIWSWWYTYKTCALGSMQVVIYFWNSDFCLPFAVCVCKNRGTRWRSRLRQCATSRKVAGSIPNGVIGIFHWHNPSGRTMALGLDQPTRNISWGGKGGRCVGLTTLTPSCADCLEIWEPQTPGTFRECPGL